MTTQAIQKQAPAPTTLGGFLELRKAHLAEILPKSSALTPEKLIKLALLATKKNAALQKCSMDTVFQSLLHCAELGLDPGGATGEAYLVPYGNVCTLVIGYRGLIKLARQSGVLRQIETHIVHEKDKFTLRYGLDPKLEHEPYLQGDAGKPLVVYCVARLGDGAVHVEVMTVAEVEAVRAKSKGRDAGPWKDHWGEMARKTVVRRAAKYLPLSPELQRAMEVEDSVEGEVVRTEDVAQAFAQPQTEKLKQLVKSNTVPRVVDVKPGETEEEAEARVTAIETPEPPPPLEEFPAEVAP